MHGSVHGWCMAWCMGVGGDVYTTWICDVRLGGWSSLDGGGEEVVGVVS